MNTIFDTKVLAELVDRITSLQADSQPEWGKMDAFQMLRHCTMSEEMFQGKKTYKRLLIGRLFGKMALSGILKNENPLKKNQPTHPDLKIKGTGDFEKERAKWIELLKGYQYFSNDPFIHPFFGVMTTENIGYYIYKHSDHHLRQFGK
tara:strand:- start:750 stop:1193 length:444 start_codon:yes stop_codon:yes gene_type:complete